MYQLFFHYLVTVFLKLNELSNENTGLNRNPGN